MQSPHVLDIYQDRPILMLDHEQPAPKAWTRDSVTSADWMVPLTDGGRKEIERLVEIVRSEPLPTLLLSPDQFELAECRRLMAQVKANLTDGMGLAVLDRLDLDGLGKEEAIKAYWVLAQCVGRPVANKWDGTMLYDVMDTGRPKTPEVRSSWTNVELYFHTDNAFGVVVPDFVSLFCLHPAREGGVSRFCSLYHVHNVMLREHPRLLRRLYRPSYFNRQAEHAPGDPKVSWVPTFSYDGERLFARLSSSLIRQGYDLMGEPLDGELAEALAALDEIMRDPAIWAEFTIERGQLQYLNNKECAHFRSEFKDHDDPERKRHMVRVWYRDSGRRFYNG